MKDKHSAKVETPKVETLRFYSFFAKYSLMEDYGFTQGLISRMLRKIIPLVPDEDTVEYILLNRKDPVPYLLSILDLKTISQTHMLPGNWI